MHAEGRTLHPYGRSLQNNEGRQCTFLHGMCGLSLRTAVLGHFPLGDVHEWDDPFHATDKCTGCRLCSEICPVGNIRIVKERPVWQHHCEHCVACIQWCPVEAIEYGQKTIGRRRYRFPGLFAAAITAGNLGLVVPE